MSATAAVTDQCKQDFMNGIHQPGDTYKIALFVAASSSLSKATTAYSGGMGGEVTGAGYSAGGATLSGFTVSLSGDTAELIFSNASWAASTITADTALIYNSSKSNKALCVLTFASASSISGTFTVNLPGGGIVTIT